MTGGLLIAGVGNLFLGDDAFGCEVTRRLGSSHAQRSDAIAVRDFGVSMRELGYVLAERSEGTTVIVDAVATGALPGTVQLFDLASPETHASARSFHHASGLGDALSLAVALGARLQRTYLLGCESASFELASELTPAVELAARRCVELLGRLIEEPGRDLVGLWRS